MNDNIWQVAEAAVVAGDVATLERLLLDHGDRLRTEPPQSSWSGGLAPRYDHPDAQSIIASNHDFNTWDEFHVFTESLKDASSPVAQFEAAVDAIVAGEAAALGTLLRGNPDLIRARSARRHHSTLLHYVGANGIEGFRQRTPQNAVAIAEALLDAGAEVDAVADMYGGGATTLGLVATSIHPKLAGVQNALIDVLLAHGARLDDPRGAGNRHNLVNGCLANGRPEAAEYLATRGATLDLAGAAGVGRVDVVKTLFEEDEALDAKVPTEEMNRAFAWACAYGRADVVDFLLERGFNAGAWLTHHGRGHTGLHVAAFGGHADIVKELLRNGAPIDREDQTWGTTPLVWALHAWSQSPMAPPDRYHEVVATLVAAGALVDREWLNWDRVRADSKMAAALTGL